MYSIMTKVVKYRRFTSAAIMTVFALISMLGTVLGAAGSNEQAAITNVRNTFDQIARNVRSFGATVCVVCAVYIGMMFIASSVNPKLRDQAKAGLWGLALGILVLVMSDQIAHFIAGIAGEEINKLTENAVAGNEN